MFRRLFTAALFAATAVVVGALSLSVASPDPSVDPSSSWVAMAFPVPPATPSAHPTGHAP